MIALCAPGDFATVTGGQDKNTHPSRRKDNSDPPDVSSFHRLLFSRRISMRPDHQSAVNTSVALMPATQLLCCHQEHRADKECFANEIQSYACPDGIISGGVKSRLRQNPHSAKQAENKCEQGCNSGQHLALCVHGLVLSYDAGWTAAQTRLLLLHLSGQRYRLVPLSALAFCLSRTISPRGLPRRRRWC